MMDTFYLTCAALGGTVLVLQLVAGLLGIGGDTDTDTDHDAGADGDHDGNSFFGALSVRTAAAALTFLGLGGLTAAYYGASEPVSIGVAIGAAAAAFYSVAFFIRSLTQLKSDGTVRIDRTIGSLGSVYLRIPASRSGMGKVHVAVQKRTVEFQAMTSGPELATGSPIRVVAVVNSDTVEVEGT
jgi:hypothetical protein